MTVESRFAGSKTGVEVGSELVFVPVGKNRMAVACWLFRPR